MAIVLVRAHFTVPAGQTEFTKCSQHRFSIVQRIHLKNKKQGCEHIIVQLFHNPLLCTFEFPLTSVITFSFILEAGLWTVRMQNTVHSMQSLLEKKYSHESIFKTLS